MPRRAQSADNTGPRFRALFFLALVRLLGNWNALGSQLPPAARVNPRKAPPERGQHCSVRRFIALGPRPLQLLNGRVLAVLLDEQFGRAVDVEVGGHCWATASGLGQLGRANTSRLPQAPQRRCCLTLGNGGEPPNRVISAASSSTPLWLHVSHQHHTPDTWPAR